jgi:hypothetical protein
MLSESASGSRNSPKPVNAKDRSNANGKVKHRVKGRFNAKPKGKAN